MTCVFAADEMEQAALVKPPDYIFDRPRRAALESQDILDTPAEPGFDDIVHLASTALAAPIALVSLVTGDRQWFKARVGFEPCQTDLSRSVCAHALVEPDVLVIADLTQDARTKENPLVTGPPYIRFYAGAPLRTDDGHVLGSICVIDVVPRENGLAEEHIDLLRILARQVMSQLALRRAIDQRDRALLQQLTTEARETTQRGLNDELGHRLKNTFSIVLAMASQSLRSVPDQNLVNAYVARVQTLSAAHDVLLQRNWVAADMADVVKAAVRNLAPAQKIEIGGPRIEIGPKATLSVAMLMHELTTNALKYGSLSTPVGRVDIRWRLDGRENAPDFTLKWVEIDGPPVSKPKRQGFGSRLIGSGLLGSGGVDVVYRPSGLEAAFRAPLSAVQSLAS